MGKPKTANRKSGLWELGPLIAVGLYEGLFVLRTWIFPVVILFSLVGLGYKIMKG
jgi:hypothetical protein